jgi:hypothetical protein
MVVTMSSSAPALAWSWASCLTTVGGSPTTCVFVASSITVCSAVEQAVIAASSGLGSRPGRPALRRSADKRADPCSQCAVAASLAHSTDTLIRLQGCERAAEGVKVCR